MPKSGSADCVCVCLGHFTERGLSSSSERTIAMRHLDSSSVETR